MGCLNCGKALKNTKGKRPKKFCNTSCRSSYGQKKKRAGKEPGKPGRPKIINVDLEKTESEAIKFVKKKTGKYRLAIPPEGLLLPVFTGLLPEVYDSPKLDSLADEPKIYDSGRGGIDMLISIPFPEDFASVLRLAKEWKGDVDAFKKRVDGLKLKPNQKLMIYSKLKKP